MNPIRLIEVHKRRGRGRRAVQVLKGASLTVAPKEIALLEGPSGSGKTTLVAVAAGLLGADQGEVHLGGHALHGLAPALRRRLRRRLVGFVFQQARLIETLSVLDNVLLQAMLADVERLQAIRRARRLLDAVGVGGLAQRRPRELSGGEEQRAALARALIHNPAVVFADEPTGNLDQDSGRSVANALAEIASENQGAVIIVSHDPRLRPIATRCLKMVGGSISSRRF